MIQYTGEKHFTQQQVQELFSSVGWVSGQYPQRLYKALRHSSTVLTAWDGNALWGMLTLRRRGEFTHTFENGGSIQRARRWKNL